MRGAPPKRPRDASSLIVYRHEGRQLKVLLGKRHIKAKFVPDVYVFPGGAVDQSDYPSLPLPVPLASHMGVGKDDRLAHALLTAAIRETKEEAGLLLASGVDHNSLRYIGRAITPVFSPVRYHARFFAAAEHLFEGDIGGDGELHDLHWASLDRAMQYPLIDVTAFMLHELRLALDADRTRLPLFAYYGNRPRVCYRPVAAK